MTRLSLRSHHWGALVVLVAAGELDADTGERLGPYIRKLQADNDLVVDLWDVTTCDPAGVAVLDEARQHAEASGWGFAVVVDPAGTCAEAIAAGGRQLRVFDDRHAARAALQGSAS